MCLGCLACPGILGSPEYRPNPDCLAFLEILEVLVCPGCPDLPDFLGSPACRRFPDFLVCLGIPGILDLLVFLGSPDFPDRLDNPDRPGILVRQLNLEIPDCLGRLDIPVVPVRQLNLENLGVLVFPDFLDCLENPAGQCRLVDLVRRRLLSNLASP